jgi:hypothetical protein
VVKDEPSRPPGTTSGRYGRPVLRTVVLVDEHVRRCRLDCRRGRRQSVAVSLEWAALVVNPVIAHVRNVDQSLVRSTVACTAVGYDKTKSGRLRGVAARLQDGQWTRLLLRPKLSHAVDGWNLGSISCPTATSCLATGEENVTGRARAVADVRIIALRETGRGWSTIVPRLPILPDRARPRRFEDDAGNVSCSAPGNCLGIGTWVNENYGGPSGGLSLAFTPTDPHPNAQNRPGLPGFGPPTSVSCPTASFCLIGSVDSLLRYTP